MSTKRYLRTFHAVSFFEEGNRRQAAQAAINADYQDFLDEQAERDKEFADMEVRFLEDALRIQEADMWEMSEEFDYKELTEEELDDPDSVDDLIDWGELALKSLIEGEDDPLDPYDCEDALDMLTAIG